MRINNRGYIINPGKKEKINKEFLPIIGDILKDLTSYCGERITSIYVRGSVSSGNAVYGHSDIDMVCILEDTVTNKDIRWNKKKSIILEKRYPLIPLVDITIVSKLELLENTDFNMLRVNLIAQSCLLYGKDIRILLPQIKPGPEMTIYLYKNIGTYLTYLYTYIREGDKKFYYLGRKKNMKVICRWIMRTILRSSLGLVMLKKAIYTPNVRICFEEFTLMYPSFTEDMKIVINWEYYPINNRKKIDTFLHTFLPKYLELYQQSLRKLID